jgi:hypothetical protein
VTRRALVIEWLILAALVCWRTIGGTLHSPERLLRWAFGELPLLRFSELHPWASLQLGLSNLFLLAGLLLIFSTTKWAERARWGIAGWFVLTLVIVPVLRDVEIRHNLDEAPGKYQPYLSQAHDGGVVQTELAGAALRRGENPYRLDYSQSSMARTADSDAEGWRATGYDHNPAFDHVPYLPAILVMAAIFPGDIRLLYLLFALLFSFVIARRFPDGPQRRLAALVSLCNPLLLAYFVVGRNEILLLVPLALFCQAVRDERWRAAAIWLGLSLAVKQFAIAAIPFLLIARRREWKSLWPVVAIPLFTMLPFLIWDARAFVDDTVVFSFTGYPVKWLGWGISPLAYGLNLVDNPGGNNPFGWLALPAELLALILLGRRVYRDPKELLLASGIFSFVMLFCSRAFAFNYLSVPVLFLALAITEPRMPRPTAPAAGDATR